MPRMIITTPVKEKIKQQISKQVSLSPRIKYASTAVNKGEMLRMRLTSTRGRILIA